MELKASITAVFLILILLAPCCSSGKRDLPVMDPGIYDIDYRGPETHTHFPSPKQCRGRHKGCHQSMLEHCKSKGFGDSKPCQTHGKKVHG